MRVLPANGRWRRPARPGSTCRNGNAGPRRHKAARTAPRRWSPRPAAAPLEARRALRTAGPASPGIAAPHWPAKRRVVATLDTGRMPGTISTSGRPLGEPVAEAQETVGREEELGDRPVRASVDLAQQIVEIALRAVGIGMDLGIGGDRNFERRDCFQARNQLGGIGVAARMRRDSAGPARADRRAARRCGGPPPPNSSARSRRFPRASRRRR